MLTSLAFLSEGQPFPPSSELERLNAYERYRQLFDGELDRAFEKYVRLLRDDQKATLQVTLNLFKRIGTLMYDLVASEPPEIRAGELDSPEQKYLDRLLGEAFVPNVLGKSILDHVRYGDAVLKVRRRNGLAQAKAQTPTVWLPVVDPDDQDEIAYHVLAWIEPGEKPNTALLTAEIHSIGQIETRFFELVDGTIKREIVLDDPLIQTHEAGDFLVFHVPNVPTTDRATGISDFRDVERLVREMSVRLSQISSILDKHADPNMYGSESQLEVDPATGRTRVRTGKFFPVGAGETPPGYVTYDSGASLEAAFSELERLWDAWYVVTEISPAAFGQQKEGLAESGSALKRLLMTTLWKAGRVRTAYDAAIRRLVRIMVAVENEAALIERRPSDVVELPSIEIVWKDGLPDDPRERVELATMKYEKGAQSLEATVRELMPDSDEKSIKAEIERIEKDREASRVEAPGAFAIDAMFADRNQAPGGDEGGEE